MPGAGSSPAAPWPAVARTCATGRRWGRCRGPRVGAVAVGVPDAEPDGRADRGADRRRDAHQLAVHGDGGAQDAGHRGRQLVQPAVRSTSAQTTTNSSPRAGAAQPGGRRSRRRWARLDEQLVAGVVAERVVDALEVVEVAEQHPGAPRRRAREQPRDRGGERAAVGQAGQLVVHGLVAQARLDPARVGDVGEHHEVGGRRRRAPTPTRAARTTPARRPRRRRRAPGCAARGGCTTSTPSPPSPRGGRAAGVAGPGARGRLGGEVEQLVGAAAAQRLLALAQQAAQRLVGLDQPLVVVEERDPDRGDGQQVGEALVEARSRSSAWRRAVTSAAAPATMTAPHRRRGARMRPLAVASGAHLEVERGAVVEQGVPPAPTWRGPRRGGPRGRLGDRRGPAGRTGCARELTPGSRERSPNEPRPARRRPPVPEARDPLDVGGRGVRRS